MLQEKRAVNIEKFIDTLNKSGITISPQEAETMLNFLYLLAEILVNNETEK